MSPIDTRRGRLDVLVVGAGQAGLAMGRELARAGRSHLILDGARQVGESWRSRWDSLRLFTPARYSALPGLTFPTAPDHLASKDEVADYLRSYASAFSLPLALDEPVRELRAQGSHDFVATTDYARYRARHVVIATGGYQAPSVPRFASLLATSVAQVHSSAYRNPSQLPDGPVLVVGAGNSGVQIAQELAATHEVMLATGRPLLRLPERFLGRSIFAWLDRTGALDIPVDSFLGRRASRREMLIGTTPADIARSHGVRVVPRIVRVEGRSLITSEGGRIEPRSVVWATGFKPSYDWLKVPVLGNDGRPRHARGLTEVPGLAFLGLPWQHTRGSSLIGRVARDAAYLAAALERADRRVRAA